MGNLIVCPFFGWMRDDVYFGLPAWDQTQLRQFAVSPLEWAAARYRPVAPWMAFGAAAHSLVLGTGPAVGLSGDGRAHRTDLAVGLPEDDLRRVRDMAAVTRPVFRQMHGLSETTMVSMHSSGLFVKGKADFIETDPDSDRPDDPIAVWDYKTTSDPLSSFPKRITGLGYDMQAAMYLRLLSNTRHVPYPGLKFRWLVQQTRPPYDYQVFETSATTPLIKSGEEKIEWALAEIQMFTLMHPEGLDILRRAYAPGRHRRRRIARAVGRYGDHRTVAFISGRKKKEKQQ